MRGSDEPVTVRKWAGLTVDNLGEIPDHQKVEDGRNVSPRAYPATTAFTSLKPGLSGIDSILAVAGVHKVKPCQGLRGNLLTHKQ